MGSVYQTWLYINCYLLLIFVIMNNDFLLLGKEFNLINHHFIRHKKAVYQ